MKLKKLNYKFNEWWFSLFGLEVANKKKFKLFSDIGFYLSLLLIFLFLILLIIINFDFFKPLLEVTFSNFILWLIMICFIVGLVFLW